MPLTLPKRPQSQKSRQDRPQKPRLIVGLDPSLTHFAVVCLSLESDEVQNQFTFAPKTDGMQRIADILDCLTGVMVHATHAGYSPILVREDYAYSANSSSDAPLKELGGIFEYEMWKTWRAPLFKVSIASIKKFMFGKGNAQKSEMMREAYKHFRFEADEHQTDAFAVAMLAKAVISGKMPPQLPRASHEAVAAMRAKQHPLTLL